MTADNEIQRLPPDKIAQRPEVFQPREGIVETHVITLKKALRTLKATGGGDLDPITVLHDDDGQITVIDGHHRLCAYIEAGEPEIPVVIFAGSKREAILLAGKGNSKSKLAMTSAEKQNFAWRLVRAGGYSKTETAHAAGVSTSQVANMRKALDILGQEEADGLPDWNRARTKADYGYDTNDREAQADWMSEVAERYADAINAATRGKLTKNPEVTAMALCESLGGRLTYVVEHLLDRVPEEWLEAVLTERLEDQGDARRESAGEHRYNWAAAWAETYRKPYGAG